jgi:ribosomal protein S18 acetylase RimI-like enzyme
VFSFVFNVLADLTTIEEAVILTPIKLPSWGFFMSSKALTLTLRRELNPEDGEKVQELEIAKELVEEALSKGQAAGYDFLFLENGHELIGYSCYGLIPGTQNSYDLYWIAVRPGHQGMGLGHWLLGETEQKILAKGGNRIYVDTSGRTLYESTRAFYQRCGYSKVATLKDFYSEGDDKVIFQKTILANAEMNIPLPMTSPLEPNLCGAATMLNRHSGVNQ